MTNDSSLFRTEWQTGCLPLYEGKMIHQFTHRWSQPRYWIDSEKGRNALTRQEIRRVEIALDELAKLEADVQEIPNRQERVTAFLKFLGYPPLSPADVAIDPNVSRLAFRDVARNTDQRTLIATILPPHVFAGNTLNYVTPWYFNAEGVSEHPSSVRDCYELTFPATTLAYFCGVLNSFTLDYLVRFKVTAHVNMFYFYQLPVPRLAPDDQRCIAIATRVARLLCFGPEFDDLRLELLGDINANIATDADERMRIQCEIDALVAHLYGLTEEEFTHVLSTFPQVEQAIKEAALAAYHDLTLEPDDLAIKEMIEKGENERVEFKVAACWNAFKKAKDESMKEKIVEAVAAFLNKNGGTLLIGIADDGTIVGLADDYRAAHGQASKQNRNGYELFLRETLNSRLGKVCIPFYSVSFHTIGGKDVCCVEMEPSDEPIYIAESTFCVRDGNGKRTLNTKEAVAYIKRRWGS